MAVVIDTCESTDGWTAYYGDLTVSSVHKYGAAGLSLKKTSTSVAWTYMKCNGNFSINTTNFEILNFWIYVADKNVLNSGTGAMSVYIGQPSNTKWWNISKDQFSNGWNEFTLYISEANTTGSPTSPYTYMQISIWSAASATVWNEGDVVIDHIIIDNVPDTPSSPAARTVENTKGTKELMRRWPITSGLTAGTTKQEGRKPYLEARKSIVPRRNRVGL